MTTLIGSSTNMLVNDVLIRSTDLSLKFFTQFPFGIILAAGETGPVKNQTQWSGFLDAGVHTLKTTDVISIIGSNSGPFVTADVIFLQPIMPNASSTAAPRQPAKRDPVNAKLNEEYFPPREARFVRFTIDTTATA